jgi:hypothetical protein
MIVGGGIAAAGRFAPSLRPADVDPVLVGTGACLAVLLLSLAWRGAVRTA